MKLTGHKEIDRVFHGMPKHLTDRVLKNAHAASARKTVLKREQQLVPLGDSFDLHDSLGVVRVPGRKQKELGTIEVGPRRSERYKGHSGHLNEYGTKQRFQKTSRGKQLLKPKNTGVMKDRPFARPAFDQTQRKLREENRIQYGKKLISFMKRTLK